MSITELDSLIRQRQSVLSWLANAGLTSSQSRSPYSLRVDVNGVQAMYCGQSYAGANNYHDAPSELNAALTQSIERHRSLLVDDAAKSLLASIETRILALHKQAQDVFASIECKGIEIAPGEYSGCNANLTGATDCPTCGRTKENKHGQV